MRVALRTDSWDRALRELGKANAIKAGVRTVNRTLSNAKTAMVRVIAADMALPAKAVRDKIDTQVAKASGQAPSGRLWANTTRLPLIDFKATQTSQGVKANTGRGRKLYAGAFIATMKSGHRGVFQRKGKLRLPIEQKHGASIAQSFTTNAKVAEARAIEQLEKNWAAEVNYLLLKAKQAA